MNNLRGVFFKEFNLYIATIEKIGVCSGRTFCLKHYNLYTHPSDLWKSKMNQFVKNINLNTVLKNNSTVLILTRNPFDRIISGYLDKFIRTLQLPFCKNIVNFYKSDINRISFKEFIDYLYINKNNSGSFDSHFRPQTKFYKYTTLKPYKNFIFVDIKNSNKINEVLSKYNFKEKYPRTSYNVNFETKLFPEIFNKKLNYYNENNICKSIKCDYSSFLNDDIRMKIISIYQDDFKFLNYKTN